MTYTDEKCMYVYTGEELLLGSQSYITPYSGQSSDWMTKFPTTVC